MRDPRFDYPIHLDDACLLTLITLVLHANTPSKLALHPDYDSRTASAVVPSIHESTFFS
jgi:hypothetical protein